MFNTLSPEHLFTPHRGEVAKGRYPSPDLWKGQVGVAPSPASSKGWVTHFDDFVGGYRVVATVESFDRYFCHVGTGATIVGVAEEGGILRLTSGATDNSANIFSLGLGLAKIGAGTPGTLTSQGTRLIFEARVRTSHVTNDTQDLFVGLGVTGTVATAGLFTDDDVFADTSLLGFTTFAADGDNIAINYDVSGGTTQALSGTNTAIAASTWYKLGMIYDPSGPDSKKMKFFVDGVELATGLTRAQVNAAAFPAATLLAPVIGIKNATAATKDFDVDWVAFAYEEA